MKALQATQIKMDICARIMIRDDRYPAPYALNISLFSLTRLFFLLNLIWLLAVRSYAFALKLDNQINQFLDNLIVWLIQPVPVPAWVPVPAFARVV